MSVNGMSVGKDYAVSFYDSNTNALVDFGDVQNFKIQPQKHDLKNMPYNGDPKFGYIADGYKFSFSIVRTSASLEAWQLAMNAVFNSGGNVKSGFLNVAVTNPDGSVSRYQFANFVFFVTDLGEVSREKMVAITAEGAASSMQQIS